MSRVLSSLPYPADFKGAARPRSAGIYQRLAYDLGWDVEVVTAFVAVEAAGAGFLADGRPKILFERHKFHAFTKGAFSAGNPDISNAKAGGYVGGRAEYRRLDRAIALDRDAAIRAASWGLPQIMGFNSSLAGFSSPGEMVAAFCRTEDDQLVAFATFVRNSGLVSAGRDKDWRKLASYNGPKGVQRGYHVKIAAEYARALMIARYGREEVSRIDDGMLQAALNAHGYGPLTVDGWFGRKSRDAARRFQRDHDLVADGVVGSATRKILLPA